METIKNRVKIPQQNKVRAELQKEINSKCPFCENEDVGHFEIHHIDEDPSNNVNENLILLCPICHSKITKGEILILDVYKKKITIVTGIKAAQNSSDSISISGKISKSVVGNNNKISIHTSTKKPPKPKYPEGCIGYETTKANYIGYLITRYHECKEYEVGKDNMKYGIFAASLKKYFNIGQSRTIYNLEIERFDELVTVMQKRIDGTVLGKINKSKGYKSYHSFEEQLSQSNQN